MKSRGFTLVELAIVLVIIGLLMGGILKGQELINSAKVKSLAGDFRAVPAAYYGYLDRFRAVPGDDGSASTHVGGTNASTGGTLNNGQVEGTWNTTLNTDESYLFWQHVRLAGLLTGSTNTATNYAPVNSEGGRVGISGNATAPIDSTATPPWRATFFVCSANINGRLARQLDTMLDDGIGDNGSMRIATGTGASATATNSLSDNTMYTVCMAF